MAGEPESLSQSEALAAHVQRHNFDRLIMLSDGVFAIAITLLALDLPVPARWDGALSSLVAGSGRALIGYGFAFLLVGAIWVGHRHLMGRIARVDLPATILTLLLLGLVGLTPFVARLIANGPTKALPTYLMTFGSIQAVRAAIGFYASWRGLLHPQVNRTLWFQENLQVTANFVLLFGLGLFAQFTGAGITSQEMTLLAVVLLFAATIRRRSRRLQRAAVS